MPNQPKTPLRAIRVDDALWSAARAMAASEGTNVSEVIRALLTDWVDFGPTDTMVTPWATSDTTAGTITPTA